MTDLGDNVEVWNHIASCHSQSEREVGEAPSKSSLASGSGVGSGRRNDTRTGRRKMTPKTTEYSSLVRFGGLAKNTPDPLQQALRVVLLH